MRPHRLLALAMSGRAGIGHPVPGPGGLPCRAIHRRVGIIFPGLDASDCDRSRDHWHGTAALHGDGPACVPVATEPGLHLSGYPDHTDHLAALLEGLVERFVSS